MRRLKTVRRPPIYPNGAQAISPVAPSPLFRCPHAVHRCPSVDSGLGESGTGEGQLTKPADVVADRSGNIYVCDWGNERVQVFDSEGRFLELTLGESGVSPWAQNFLNINVEEGEARSRADLDKPDIPLPDPNDRNLVSAHIEKYFWAPMALAISPDNRLFVLESNRHRIQIFEIVG